MSFYFAYDTSLSIGDLIPCGGIPSDFKPVGPALLPDRELAFVKGDGTEGGCLDVRRQIGAALPGYLFNVTDRGKAVLNRVHGVAAGFSRVLEVVVITPDGRLQFGWTYESLQKDVPGAPSARYLERVRLGLVLFGVSTDAFERAVARHPAPCAIDELFVYGTLMRGDIKHALAQPERIAAIEGAVLRGELRNGGSYPFLLLPATGATYDFSVRGEVFTYRRGEIPLAELDAYEEFEGYGYLSDSLFGRTIVSIRADGGAEKLAWTYVSVEEHADLPTITSGDWRSKQVAN